MSDAKPLTADQRRYAASLLRQYLGSAYRLEKDEIPLSLPTFAMREVHRPGDAPLPMPDIARGRFAVPVQGAKGLHADPTAGAAIEHLDGSFYTIRIPVQMVVARRDVVGAIAGLPTHQQVALSRVVIAGQGGAQVARDMRLGKTTVNDWADQALAGICAMLYGERWGELAA